MTVTISRWATGFYVEVDGVVKCATSRYDRALRCAEEQGTPNMPWPKSWDSPKIERTISSQRVG
jgi:hypothetical protein